MVTRYKISKKATINEYLVDEKNAGRVAVFDLDIPGIVAEGDKLDWVELELLYEELRKTGNYELVICRRFEPTVKIFERLPV